MNTHIILTRRDFFISNCIDCQLQASIISVLSRGTEDKGCVITGDDTPPFHQKKRVFSLFIVHATIFKKRFLSNKLHLLGNNTF